MKHITRILIIGLATAILTACGGGGGDDINLPTVDNSVLADGENEWGYYGADVLFGEYRISQTWTLIDEEDPTIRYSIEFFSDGDFLVDGYFVGVYGVSVDGRTIRSDILKDMSIIGVKEDYYGVYDNGVLIESYDCYNISGGDRPVVMCTVAF